MRKSLISRDATYPRSKNWRSSISDWPMYPVPDLNAHNIHSSLYVKGRERIATFIDMRTV
jgi:hypothetical protein